MERLCEILNFDWKGSGEYFSLQEGDVCRMQRWVKEYLWPRGCTGVAFATVVNYWLLLSHLRRLTGVSWQDVGYLSAGAPRAMQCLPHLSHSAPLATPMACPHQGPFLQLWCWKEDTWNWPTKDINCEWEINQRSGGCLYSKLWKLMDGFWNNWTLCLIDYSHKENKAMLCLWCVM